MQRRAESDRDASHLVEMMSISTYSLGQPANSASGVLRLHHFGGPSCHGCRMM